MSDQAKFIEFDLPEPEALEQDWNTTDRAGARYRAGHRWLARGHFATAAAHFEQAARYDRSFCAAAVSRTEALILLGRLDDAAAVIDEALERFGRNPDLGAARGHVFLHADEVDLALECCDTATRLAPESAYAWLVAGETRLRLKDALWSAEQSFETARRCRDRWPCLEVRIALAYLEWGHPGRTTAILRRVVESNERLPLAWILYGDACRTLKQWRHATTCYKRAAALEPDLESVREAVTLKARLAARVRSAAERVSRFLQPVNQ